MFSVPSRNHRAREWSSVSSAVADVYLLILFGSKAFLISRTQKLRSKGDTGDGIGCVRGSAYRITSVARYRVSVKGMRDRWYHRGKYLFAAAPRHRAATVVKSDRGGYVLPLRAVFRG